MSRQYILSHLRERNFDISLYRNVMVCEDAVYFIMFTMSGQWSGYQRYNPYVESKTVNKNPFFNRYFTRAARPLGTVQPPIWGLEILNPTDRRVFVTEGVFKSCRFHNEGLNSVAILGNDSKTHRNFFLSCGYHTIAVCDGDIAGKSLSRGCHSSYYLPESTYVDNMTNEEFKTLTEILKDG